MRTWDVGGAPGPTKEREEERRERKGGKGKRENGGRAHRFSEIGCC